MCLGSFSRSSVEMMSLSNVVAWSCLGLLAGCAAAPENGGSARSANASQSWQALFNGRDLSGWEVVGAGNWTVEDGEIVVRREPGQAGAGWLVTERDYGDFKLRLKFKTRDEHFNSGILIRDPAHAKKGRPAFSGYEIQIFNGNGESEHNTNGAIYDVARSYYRAVKLNEWHEFEVHCIGDHIVTYMDGEKMAEAHSQRSSRGGIGLQLHGGREETEMRWKDIEILEMPEVTEHQ